MLLRVLLGLFFIAHGLVHVALWAPKYDPKKVPFDASRSWLLGEQRPLARVLAFAAAVILVVAGIALLAQGGWWRPTAVVGLGVSTVLMLVYFTPWYLFILAVNIALVVGIAWLEWPARSTVGVSARNPRWAGERDSVRLSSKSEHGTRDGSDALSSRQRRGNPLPPAPEWGREALWTRR